MNFTADCQLNHLQHAEEVTVQILSVMKTYSPSFLVAFCVVSIVAAILSVSGNALVFLTVVSFSELHITSNIGLASLALANVLEGLSVYGLSVVVSVVTIQDGCPFSEFFAVPAAFLANISVFSSLLNLSLVTIERFIAVQHSLRYRAILHERRIAKLIAAIWFTSLLLSIPVLVDNAAEVSQTIMTIVFLLTIVLTFYFNVKIHRVSRRQRRQIMAQAEAIRQIAAANQLRFRGATTMFLILVSLLICFVPAFVVRLLARASPEATNLTSLTLARPWAAVFFGLYSCVSPFIYFFRSRELRRFSNKLLRRGLRLLTFKYYS